MHDLLSSGTTFGATSYAIKHESGPSLPLYLVVVVVVIDVGIARLGTWDGNCDAGLLGG